MPIEDNSASVRGYWQARSAADTFAKSVGALRRPDARASWARRCDMRVTFRRAADRSADFAKCPSVQGGINIYDEKYRFNGSSKAKHMRAFIATEDEFTVARVLRRL
jgi:hypothetical protein